MIAVRILERKDPCGEGAVYVMHDTPREGDHIVLETERRVRVFRVYWHAVKDSVPIETIVEVEDL